MSLLRISSLVALLLLTWAAPALAQFTLIGEVYTSCGTAAATCTASSGTTAASGDLIYIQIYNRDLNDVSSIADGVNTGYTCPDGLDLDDTVRRIHGCYFINSGSGTVTPVVTHSANSRVEMQYQVWRPTGTVTIDTTQEGTNASGTTHVTPTLSTGANAALVVCGFGSSSVFGAPTAGTGYTLLTDADNRLIGQYDITSVSSGSFTCSITSTNAVVSVGIGASFNDSGGGGGGGTPSRLTLLGVGAQ